MLVAVIHTRSHQRFEWTIECFETRMFAMRELYRRMENGANIDIPEIADPFFENPDADVRIGTARLYLQPLTYMVRVKENLEIINFRAEPVGLMEVCMLEFADRNHREAASLSFLSLSNFRLNTSVAGRACSMQ